MQHLEGFFHALERFQYAKAAEVLKLKVNITIGGQPYWSNITSPLILLSACENVYYSMTYLDGRWLKRDHIDNMYTQVVSDLSKLNNALTKLVNGKVNVDQYIDVSGPDGLLHLVQNTSLLGLLRTDMLTLYRGVVGPSFKPQETISLIKQITAQFTSKITHPLLAKIKAATLAEIAALESLVMAQIHTSTYQFRDAAVSLWQAKTAITTLFKNERGHEHMKLEHGLYEWLNRVCSALTAKYLFFFHNILRAKERDMGSDIKFLTQRAAVDYHGMVENFVHKTEAFNFSLILEAGQLPPPLEYQPNGYADHPPDYEYERPTGLSSYPAIYTYPQQEYPKDHWPNIVSILLDTDTAKNNITFYYDKKVQVSYFLSKIDQHITAAIIFANKKRQDDPGVQEFLNVLNKLLKCFAFK